MENTLSRVMFGHSESHCGMLQCSVYIGNNIREIFSYGKIPYGAYTNEETIQKVNEGYRLPIPGGCPADLYEMMKDCWKVDAQTRPTMSEIAQVLHIALTKIGGNAKVSLPDTSNNQTKSPIYQSNLYN
jgi:hypothetical protein